MKTDELYDRIQILRHEDEGFKRRLHYDPRLVAARQALQDAEMQVELEIGSERQANRKLLDEATLEYKKLLELEKQAIVDGKLDYERKVRFVSIPRVERPRSENGMDWERTRMVLVRYGFRELWWLRSGKCWVDQLVGYASTGGGLIKARFEHGAFQGRGVEYNHMSDGGRLSKALILSHSNEINSHFGIPDVAENINIKETLVVEEL